MGEEAKLDKWDKFKIINGAIATIAIPAAIAFVGNKYSLSIKEKEIQGKYVELAVNILAATPKTDTEPVREWAVHIVSKYSGVEMSAQTVDKLVKETTLPQFTSKSSSETVDQLMDREGGYHEYPGYQGEAGQAVNFGIDLRMLSEYLGHPATKDELKNLDKATAKVIYMIYFFYNPKFYLLPKSVHQFAIYSAVNHGARRAIKFMQALCTNAGYHLGEEPVVDKPLVRCLQDMDKKDPRTLVNGLVDLRIAYYKKIVQNLPSQSKYLKGWIKRADSLRPQ
jgi:lysozyme family protein